MDRSPPTWQRWAARDLARRAVRNALDRAQAAGARASGQCLGDAVGKLADDILEGLAATATTADDAADKTGGEEAATSDEAQPEAGENVDRIDDSRVSAPPTERGRPPTGDDDLPIECHHDDQECQGRKKKRRERTMGWVRTSQRTIEIPASNRLGLIATRSESGRTSTGRRVG